MNAALLNYRMDGAGPRIVLLHPVGLDLTFFDSLTAELSSRYQVLRVDLRGHGRTPRAQDDPEPRLEDFADDVHALLQHLNYAPAVVIGFSFGGMVAQELALHHPKDVSALVASACGSTFTEEMRKVLRERGTAAERDGMASLLDVTIERWFTAAFRERGEDAPARQRLLADDIESWKQTWNAIAGLRTASRLHEIHIPTLCLAAEKDLSTPPSVVEAVAKAIPGARFEVVPDMPHMLFIEAPKAVATAIAEFLQDALRA